MTVPTGSSSFHYLDLALPQGAIRLSESPYPNAEARVVMGGVPEISSLVSLDSTEVPTCELSVNVADEDRKLEQLLEGAYQCRRSVATITRLAGGVETRRFTGILDDWDFHSDIPGVLTLKLRVDDAPLQNSWAPHIPILKSEWGEGSYVMPDGVAGIGAPYLYGSHNSSGVTGKGFVPLICVGYTGTTGRYLVSFGRAKTKIGTWKADGSAIAGTMQYVSRGGKWFTTVNYASGITAGLVINGDFEGYDEDGYGLGALIVNPVRQLRHLLNVVYGDKRSGAWVTTDVAPIEAVSWAAAADWCDDFKIEGSAYIGGSVEKVAVRQVVTRWLASFPLFKLTWTPYGQLRLVNLAQALAWPGYATVSSRRVSAESQQPAPRTKVLGNVASLTRQVSGSHLFGANEGKSYSTIDVQDPAVIEKVTASIQMDWSLSRAA